jgi:hypothetical protein
MSKLIGWTLAGALFILLVWAGSGAFLYWYHPKPEEHGTFGDMFGAINALFSGWAFLGVVIAIILQRQELEMQRQEIREARIAHQVAANAQLQQLDVVTFRAQLEALNHIISGFDRRIERIGACSTLDEKNEYERLTKERDLYEERIRSLIQSRVPAQ